ncbi:peptidase [Paenibacillus oryzae]|uniref:Peptidase n=2 Tax=Paenibacillus oryzae TaxID=1844972 RepID=A0A1A5YGF9_9BACL|nr:peptidase [Paenibacillus oryzae]
MALILLLYFFYNDEAGRFLPFVNKNTPPVAELHPVVLEHAEKLVEEAAAIGISVLITQGHRSEEEQNELYNKGRTSQGAIVTYARGGESYHNYGLAIDFALLNAKGKALWDLEYDGNRNGKSDWHEVAALAKKIGFSWGGDWKGFKDYPHLQMDFGYSINELSRGFRPGPDVQPETGGG